MLFLWPACPLGAIQECRTVYHPTWPACPAYVMIFGLDFCFYLFNTITPLLLNLLEDINSLLILQPLDRCESFLISERH
jgi:hypothetical protein